jgi:VanZ family protein
MLLGLAASAGVFELLQIAIPGRTAELQGFVSGILGVCCGTLLIIVAERWRARAR